MRIGGGLLALVECRQRIHVEQYEPARGEQPAELLQHHTPLLEAECAEVAHDHDDQVELTVGLKGQVVHVDIPDIQSLFHRGLLRVLNGAR